MEKQERLLREQLGRELTPREKFYLALADACAASGHSERAVRSESQRSVRPKRNVHSRSVKRSRPEPTIEVTGHEVTGKDM